MKKKLILLFIIMSITMNLNIRSQAFERTLADLYIDAISYDIYDFMSWNDMKRSVRINDQSNDSTLYTNFFLTEEEQLLMSAAQYDVDMYAGAELYLVGFMESRLQEVTESAYLPSVQVISQLCERNEEYRTEYGKWCSLRRALEERLSEHRKQRLEGLS